MLSHDQIQQYIDQLDAHVPKEDADMLIWCQGDTSGCEIIANRIGYLRFGTEMLKAALVELEPGTIGTNVSLNYMELPKWSLHVSRIARREDLRAFSPQFPVITWKTHVMASFEIFLGIFACVCLLIGFGQVLVWLCRLLF
ncbi:MAG TPA: hypothetical protein VMG82_06950 [Candidatus Sulfotelmatobacter sp.]|nr:hypothetical protein [Candidatus Sulfotelmatobacter sp.]